MNLPVDKRGETLAVWAHLSGHAVCPICPNARTVACSSPKEISGSVPRSDQNPKKLTASFEQFLPHHVDERF
jgi:hypothetical protein